MSFSLSLSHFSFLSSPSYLLALTLYFFSFLLFVWNDILILLPRFLFLSTSLSSIFIHAFYSLYHPHFSYSPFTRPTFIAFISLLHVSYFLIPFFYLFISFFIIYTTSSPAFPFFISLHTHTSFTLYILFSLFIYHIILFPSFLYPLHPISLLRLASLIHISSPACPSIPFPFFIRRSPLILSLPPLPCAWRPGPAMHKSRGQCVAWDRDGGFVMHRLRGIILMCFLFCFACILFCLYFYLLTCLHLCVRTRFCCRCVCLSLFFF